MVVDTSAIMAIILDEPAEPAITEALDISPRSLMAAPTRTELLIVAHQRRGVSAAEAARRLLDRAEVVDVPFDRALAEAAAEAYVRYGKGNHPARLNMGDCFTYAVAKRAEEPILCVGDDFARTDVPVVPLVRRSP